MRKNKLIAGILSLVMTASLMPMQAMAKTVLYSFYDHDFETGEAAPNDRFRLNSTRTVRWQSDGARLAPEDWTYEVVDETESNKALKFTFDSEGGTKTLSDNGNKVGGLIIADMPNNIFDKTKKQWYEYSFSYKIDEPLNMNADYFMTMTDIFGLAVRMKYQNNKIVVGGNSFDPMFGKWVNVKWDIRYYPEIKDSAVRITRDYIDDKGETVTETLFEDMGNKEVSMGLLALQVASAGMTDGASFMIDNIYACRLDAADLTKVTFNTMGGSAVDPVQTAIGKINLAWAGTPTKEGATFAGWYRDETLTEPFDGTGVEENITVYAKYNENRKVTFVTNDPEITLNPRYTGTGSIELPDISKEGYAISWWKDAEFTQEFDGTGITEDITVYAKWEKLHTVTFDTNGGNTIDPVPTRENYGFIGWYKDADCTSEFDGIGITEDITVYALWQTNPTVSAITPENGAEGVDSQPTVKIYFDSKMDLNTINKSNIKIYKGDKALDEQYYTVSASHNVNGKTDAVITFAHRLDLKGEYTVKVLTGVRNLHYNMAEDFTSSFTVTGLALNARVISVKDSSGNDVESLKANAGKTIKINIELKNNTADPVTCTPIIGVHSGSALKGCGIMQAQTVEESSTPEFELKLPQDAEDGDTISMFTVDGLQTIKPLALKLNIK